MRIEPLIHADSDHTAEPTSCSSSTTVTDCSIDCNVELDGRTLSTSCYSTTCSDNVGCNVYPSTTTSETISACPIRAPYDATFAPGQIPMLGEGGYAGSVVAQGTLSNPGGTATRTSTSTRTSPSSGTATMSTRTSTRTSTSTSTSADPSYISCSTQNQQPGQGITRAYCVCSGSTFAQSTATDPPNSCAYTSLPGSSQTISISRLPTGPTTTQRPEPTSEPEPEPEPEPEDQIDMCISLSVTPTSQFPVYNYIAFPLGRSTRNENRKRKASAECTNAILQLMAAANSGPLSQTPTSARLRASAPSLEKRPCWTIATLAQDSWTKDASIVRRVVRCPSRSTVVCIRIMMRWMRATATAIRAQFDAETLV